jgi:hypothetical protein
VQEGGGLATLGRGLYVRFTAYHAGMTNVPSGDNAWRSEDPTRPFRPWLEEYLNSDATVVPLGELGLKCREEADRLVTRLLSDPEKERAQFTRSLSFLLLDAYRLNGWYEYDT